MKKINLISITKRIIVVFSIISSTLFFSCESPEIDKNNENSSHNESSVAATIRAANSL